MAPYLEKEWRNNELRHLMKVKINTDLIILVTFWNIWKEWLIFKTTIISNPNSSLGKAKIVGTTIYDNWIMGVMLNDIVGYRTVLKNANNLVKSSLFLETIELYGDVDS